MNNLEFKLTSILKPNFHLQREIKKEMAYENFTRQQKSHEKVEFNKVSCRSFTPSLSLQKITEMIISSSTERNWYEKKREKESKLSTLLHR